MITRHYAGRPLRGRSMAQCLTMGGNFGNPASRSHAFGWKAEEVVENARQQVADYIHADPREMSGPAALQNPTTWL